MRCMNCGFENRDGEFYCANCRHKLPGADERLIDKQIGVRITAAEANKRILLLRALFIFIFIVLLIIVRTIMPFGIIRLIFFIILIGLLATFFGNYRVNEDIYSKEIFKRFGELWKNNWSEHFGLIFAIVFGIILIGLFFQFVLK